MRAGSSLRAVQLRCQLFVQDFVDERGLARTRNTGHTGQRAERNREIRVLEVVHRTALDRDALAVAFAPDFGHRNEFFARKVLSGNGFVAFQQLVYRALEHDLAAVASRPRTDVHDVVSRKHGVLVMLDHNERVAEVAQPPQGRKQLVVVALMQTDGRLVEDIQHAHQRRADLRCQPDTLALAAGQRAGRARKRQIFQSDRLQKAETVHNLLDYSVTDFVLHFGQLERVEELHRLDDRLFRKLRDVQSAERDRQHLRAQTAAVACRTRTFAHHFFNLAARPLAVGLTVTALQIGDDTLERLAHHAARNAADRQLERFISGAVQQLVERLLGELLDGRFQRKAVFFAECVVVHRRDRTRIGAAPAGRTDGALLDGKMAVRDNAVRVNALLDAQTRAYRTRAVWVVEREHARRKLLDRNAAVVAGVVLRERDGFAANDIRNHQTARQRRGGLHRIRNASAGVRTDDNTVNNDLNVVLLGFRQLEFF